jgi:hypothetical protein
MSSPATAPAELAAAAASQVLDGLAALGQPDGGPRAVVVDSPPGAGKSALVVRAAALLAERGGPVMVIAQTNEQVDDLVCRLAGEAPGLAVGRLGAEDYAVPPRVAAAPSVTVARRAADLAGCPVIAGTAAKWATVRDGSWPWAVVDEAYQMRSDMLLRVACRFERALFVGDPGQLDPFSVVGTERWLGLAWDPMQSAVAVLLRNNPSIPVRRLPVSWRLPASAAEPVAEAFYPFSGFAAGTAPSERRLSFATSGLGTDTRDEALDLAAATGWALYELPARQTVRTDAEAVAACAGLAARLLERGAIAWSERSPAGEPVTPARIAIGTAHRDQAAAIRARLTELGVPCGSPGPAGLARPAAPGVSPGPPAPGITAGADPGPPAPGVAVDTANKLQGREFDVVIVLHPLSGRRDATAFHLEAGRLCVLCSRHRHACIVVARAGIPELLDAHPHAEPVYLNVPAKFPDGWAANQAMLAHLSQFRVRAS